MYHVVLGRRATASVPVVVGLHAVLLLVLLPDHRAVPPVHEILDLGRHERTQTLRLRRRHKLNLARNGPVSAPLCGCDLTATALILLSLLLQEVVGVDLMVQLLLVLQMQFVRRRPQQRMLIVERVVLRRLLEVFVSAAGMLVSHITEMLVLMAVGTTVLMTVHGLSRVSVFVRHFATVFVVVCHLTGMDQRYSLVS